MTEASAQVAVKIAHLAIDLVAGSAVIQVAGDTQAATLRKLIVQVCQHLFAALRAEHHDVKSKVKSEKLKGAYAVKAGAFIFALSSFNQPPLVTQ
jgi:uncharacterized protein YwlG (UPF0340 family)